MGKRLDVTLAILNGVVGHHLERTGNALATEMTLFHEGASLPITREALARAYPAATPRIVVLVHGLVATESMWQWTDGSDYGSRLAADCGYTPLYVRYNTGLGIPESGARLARLLDALCRAYPRPIDEILLIGHSMGGLVLRSACHLAGIEKMDWLARVRRAIYIGTPHLGAPLERAWRVVSRFLRMVPDPYTRLIAEVTDFRSDGIKDLGDAALRAEDRVWRGRPAVRVSIRDPRHPVPLLPELRHYFIAGSLPGHSLLAALFGDALVPMASAIGEAETDASRSLPPEQIRLLPGIPHVTLAHHPEVYAQLRRWCEEGT